MSTEWLPEVNKYIVIITTVTIQYSNYLVVSFPHYSSSTIVLTAKSHLPTTWDFTNILTMTSLTVIHSWLFKFQSHVNVILNGWGMLLYDIDTVCDPILKNHTSVINFEQTLTFKCLLFGHYMQEANEIWSLEGALTGLLRYQISLASCTKWPNNVFLKLSIC